MSDETAGDILEPIASLIGERSRKPMSRSVAACLNGPQSNLFVKTVEFESLPSRLRATFGVQRRGTGHVWPVAELMNSIEAFRRGAPVPQVKGFGYRRRSHQLIQELFLVSEVLEQHVDGLKWLQQGGDAKSFLRSALKLCLELHEREIFHLDMWAANFMLNPKRPDKLKVVDLENCYIGVSRYLPEIIGFQLGFLYYREANKYISEDQYDSLVAEVLGGYPSIDKQRFASVFSVCKHHHICRKTRRGLVVDGVLVIK